MSGPWVEINLSALQHNVNVVKQHAPNSSILAMVKTDAYGHGAVRVAKALQNTVQAFGVARLEEALVLKEAGIQKPIVLMGGFLDVEELPIILKNQFEMVVHHDWQVQILESFAEVNNFSPLQIWFKIDTGMTRFGFLADEAVMMHERLLSCPLVKKPLRFMTHFAISEQSQDLFTHHQQSKFEKIVESWEGERCLAKSSAILAWPSTHADWVRPGLMLYGASPFPGQLGEAHQLKPVMTFKARLVSVKTVSKDTRVGYGASYYCPENMTVGVAAVGYGDGYPRTMKTGAPVKIGDKIARVIAPVAMDLLTLDLRDIPDAKPGDVITLWGEGLPIETVASYTGTNAHAVMVGVKQRVKYYEL